MYPPHASGASLRLLGSAPIRPLAATVAAATLVVLVLAVATGGLVALVGALVIATALPLLRREADQRMLGIGLVAVGVAVTFAAVGDAAGAHPRWVVGPIIAGLAVAGAVWIPVLATSQARMLDAAGIGLSGMFTFWALVVTPRASLASVTFWVTAFSACILGAVVVALVRRVATAFAAGVGAAVVGMDGLGLTLASEETTLLPALLSLPVAVAPVLVWQGVRSASPYGQERTSHPFLLIATAFAGAVALARLVSGGDFDRATSVLGAACLVVVAVREGLTARTASRHAREASEREQRWRGLVDELRSSPHVEVPTGLANRREMLRWIDMRRSLIRPRGAVLLLRAERGATDRLQQLLSGTDVAARLSDEIFGVLTEADPVQAYALATRLIEALGPVAAVGMADVAGGAHAEDVLRRAVVALRRAEQIPSRLEWFDDGLVEALALRRAMEIDLPGAMVRGELDVVYQPMVDLVAQRPVAVEALLRWRHPTLGTLLPYEVIPVAEQLGLIGEIDEWVLNRSCRQLATWLRQGRDLSVAVNVSAGQLDHLPERVSATLDLHALPPERLVVELADASLSRIDRPEDRVAALRGVGVRTALDDFGTGPSSLSHVRGVPVDLVKVGPSFFASAGSPVSVDVIVGLGRRLGIDVVAHGLEAPAHLAAVRAAGCRIGQGHLLARPRPVEHTEAFLDGVLRASA